MFLLFSEVQCGDSVVLIKSWNNGSRRGSRINADRFPKRAPQAQASRGFRGNALLGIFFYIYLTPEKSPFMDF